MKLILTFFVLILSAHQSVLADMTNADAFSLGKSVGDAGKDKNFSGINNSNASAHVPGYSTSSSESQYYQDGMGTITPPANADVDNCMSKTTDADKQSHGHCESVRMINQSKGKAKSMFTLDPTKDPLLTKGKDAQNNPSQYTGSTATGGDYSGCQQKTVKDPDVYEEEVCNEYASRSEYNCSEKLTVEVTRIESCVPGTYIVEGKISNIEGGDDVNWIDAACSASFTSMPFRIKSCDMTDGCYGDWRGFTIDMTKQVTHAAAPVKAYEYMSGWAAFDVTYTTNGCDTSGNAFSCSITFEFWRTNTVCSMGPCGIGCYTCTSSSSIAKTMTLTYESYHVTYSYKDTWDDGCKQYKDRMQ